VAHDHALQDSDPRPNEEAPRVEEAHDRGRAAARAERTERAERPQPATKPPAEEREPSVAPSKKPSFREQLRRHPCITAAALLLVLAGIIVGVVWWLHARQVESTDDAFIDTRVVPISAQLSGMIVDVPITDNQLLEEGAVLLRVDDRDYRAALAQAKAQLDQATATIDNLNAQIDAQQARIEQAQKQVAQTEAALKFAEEEDARAQDLVKKGAGTVQNAQQTASSLRQQQAAYAGAKANELAAEKEIAVLRTQQRVAVGQLEQAQAAEDLAKANLSRTTITAPTAGRATKITAAKGAYAQPGQTLLMFVPRDVWVTANYKETQLTAMHPGQPVDIAVDAYPGRTFAGHVDSIQAGSGAAFALLPPENATGNYVKVVQRVPVKIVFDPPPDVYLGPGMSVVPSVRVR